MISNMAKHMAQHALAHDAKHEVMRQNMCRSFSVMLYVSMTLHDIADVPEVVQKSENSWATCSGT
jgi:hypothetical protein